MREIIELQSGQVAFLSGLLAGFSLTVAANVLQLDMRRIMPRICLTLLMLSTLLFLVALYVDVRLTIELAPMPEITAASLETIQHIRTIGTTSATCALVVFIVAIGALGWIAGKFTGALSTLLALAALLVLAYVWLEVASIQQMLY
jgi:hypothetical protein